METRVLEGYVSNSAFFLLIFPDLQAQVSQGQELRGSALTCWLCQLKEIFNLKDFMFL